MDASIKLQHVNSACFYTACLWALDLRVSIYNIYCLACKYVVVVRQVNVTYLQTLTVFVGWHGRWLLLIAYPGWTKTIFKPGSHDNILPRSPRYPTHVHVWQAKLQLRAGKALFMLPPCMALKTGKDRLNVLAISLFIYIYIYIYI